MKRKNIYYITAVLCFLFLAGPAICETCYVAEISGVVTKCSTVTALRDVTVTYNTGFVVTPDNGSYSITDAQEGRYALEFKKLGYKTKKIIGTWLCDWTYTKNVCLSPLCELNGICGQVTDNETGLSKASITVNLYQSGCGGDTLVGTTTTDVQGYYVFGNLGAATNYKTAVDQTGCTAVPESYADIVIPKTGYRSHDFTATCE